MTPADEGSAAAKRDDDERAARKTLADHMRSLDQHLMLAIADCQAAHAECRSRWRSASIGMKSDDANVAAEWNSWRFVGDMLGQLQTLRGRL
jgi:hypothetical protein